MGQLTIEGVMLTPLKIFESDKGNVMHCIKNSSPGFRDFGEAYISIVNHDITKGWKKHTKMTLNLTVVSGKVKFYLFDDRIDVASFGSFNYLELGRSNYQRLTIPPGIFVAFKGLEETENMLINVADITHDPDEAVNKPLDDQLFSKVVW